MAALEDQADSSRVGEWAGHMEAHLSCSLRARRVGFSVEGRVVYRHRGAESLYGESAGQAGSRWQSLALGTALGTTHAQQTFALQLSAATRWGAGRGQEQPALRPPSSAPPTHAESELWGEVVSQAGEAAPSWPGSAPAGGWGLIL